ncbi:MAG: MarR family transcriptional regulator [Actinomycetota bacterium]|nr:MarR family transcriptional regulator [Actinomycetota bacterium]
MVSQPASTATVDSADAPPPTPERAQLPGYVVNWAARLFGRAFNRRLQTVGASVGQWPILLALLQQDGLTQAELVRRLDLEQPTVANTLKRMHRDGLIQRVPHPTDGRQEHVHLTDRGRTLAPQLMEMAAEVNRAALAGLSPEEALTLLELLHRVIDNLRADIIEKSGLA